jgi:hypothetical protein
LASGFTSGLAGVLTAVSSEPNGQYQGLALSVLATGAVAAGFKGAGAGAGAAGSFAATLSDEPNGHQLLPSESFFGVCAQPVIAKQRAKARVLLDDIGYPQNKVMKKSDRIGPHNQMI